MESWFWLRFWTPPPHYYFLGLGKGIPLEDTREREKTSEMIEFHVERDKNRVKI